MKLPIYQVDAFTRRIFAGNPAAVVLLEEWLPDRTLAAIAAENNLAETAFVIPRGEAMPLRWFTPTTEVDLCGHATLATAHVLFHRVCPSEQRLTFATRSGNLAVTRHGDLLTLDFPVWPSKPVEITDAFVSALGIRPCEAHEGRHLMAIFDSESQVRELQPDIPRIAALDSSSVIVSAPGDSVDYVYRFFAPRHGIAEDPVTGSANCTLVPYWSARLRKTDLSAQQVSARGGDVRCRLEGDRVFISGSTAEYLSGEINVDV